MFKGWREFFTYSKSQRRGIYILLFLIFVLQIFLWYQKLWRPDEPLQVKVTLPRHPEKKQSISSGTTDSAHSSQYNDQPKKDATSLFPFNPNSVSAEQLQQLGLSAAQAHTFVKYRNSGAVFRSPEDMLKVYSVSDSWYQRVKNYIEMDSVKPAYQAKNKSTKNEQGVLHLKPFDLNEVTAQKLQEMGLQKWQAAKIMGFREKFRPFFNKSELYDVYGLDSALAAKLQPFATADSARVMQKLQVELNNADSITLAGVPGIGSYTAARILKYKNRLGGFTSLQQLYEMYGADSSRIARYKPYLLLDSSNVKTLNINRAPFKEMLGHPYLTYEIVKSIENYRTHVGEFTEVEQLRNIPLVDDVLFTKIAKYLTVE